MENKEEPFFLTLTTKDLSQGKQRRMKRGLGAKPLLESEIKDATKKDSFLWKLLGYWSILQHLQKIR